MELLMPRTHVFDRIEKLEAERSALLAEAREEALATIHDNIERLQRLGYSYTLVEGQDRSQGGPSAENGKLNGTSAKPLPTRTGKRTRRAGIRQEVLSAIADAGKNGMTRGELIAQFRAKDDSFKQSISNALSALKKQRQVKAAGGVYKAAARK